MPAVAVRPRAGLQPRTSILIIGGDARVRNAHAIELGTHGYEVDCADSIETAFTTYGQKRRALVLFAMDVQSCEEWEVYRLIACEHPEQPMAFALSGSLKLCPVSFAGTEIMQGQKADDLVSMVEELIGSPN